MGNSLITTVKLHKKTEKALNVGADMVSDDKALLVSGMISGMPGEKKMLELEEENRRLKQLLAELLIKNYELRAQSQGSSGLLEAACSLV